MYCTTSFNFQRTFLIFPFYRCKIKLHMRGGDNMGSKFEIDMKKLEKSIMQQSEQALNKRMYDVKCPHCNAQVKVPTGKSKCPYCRNEIDLSLNIDFTK